MAMTEYSPFHKAPELEPHHHMQFSVRPRWCTVCIYYSPTDKAEIRVIINGIGMRKKEEIIKKKIYD